MGNYIVHKGLLLDEGDFDLSPTADFERVVSVVTDYLQDEFGTEDDWPGLEIFGMASERLGAVEMLDSWSNPMWIEASTSFVEIVRKAAARLDLPRVTASWDVAEAGDPTYQRRLQEDICDLVRAGSYRKAVRLLEEVADLLRVGLPGFRPDPLFSHDSENEFIDFREKDHGSGRRLFVEIGFNWGD